MKPNVMPAECWGALAATSFDFAGANNLGPASFDHVDLAKQEEYRKADGSPTPVAIGPDGYEVLSVGRKMTYHNSGIRAVTYVTTTCEVAGHGFVLDPQGNRTF